MSAEIISFRSARALMACARVPPSHVARRTSIERQLVRIEGLLEELEVLAGDCERTLSTIDRTRRFLQSIRLDEEEADPQPEIDRALLERLYRELKKP